MDNHHLMLKISRLFPSSFTSCQFRTLPDVADSSIPIAKENDRSSLSNSLSPKKLPKTSSALPRTLIPPAKRAAVYSSTSNGSSSWFTSGDDVETDTFFSLSSNSSDSFRLRTASQRFKRRDEMKSIDELGRCSFSSAASAAAKKPTKTSPDQHYDHFSAQLYYRSNGTRRRKASRNRRKSKKSGGGEVIGESYAVEKSSSDPRGDFRASMVEMIVEKGIFAAADLERLLRCFLSLNAAAYHGIIFDVFNEICQTLFTN